MTAWAPRAKGRRLGEHVSTDLVEYLIVVVPDVDLVANVAAAVDDLVQAATIRILDVVVLARGRDSTIKVFEFEDVPRMTSLRETTTERDGLLSEHDLAMVSQSLPSATAGLVLVVEDRWAASLSRAARSAGGEIIAGERIPAARVEAVMRERGEVGGP
jgi:Family of unknown function (DUF6325)